MLVVAYVIPPDTVEALRTSNPRRSMEVDNSAPVIPYFFVNSYGFRDTVQNIHVRDTDDISNSMRTEFISFIEAL